MKKEKQFNLVLHEPGKEPVCLAQGSIGFVSAERTKQSFKYNSDFLIIEEAKDEDDEIEINLVSVLASLVISSIILLVYGKKRK